MGLTWSQQEHFYALSGIQSVGLSYVEQPLFKVSPSLPPEIIGNIFYSHEKTSYLPPAAVKDRIELALAMASSIGSRAVVVGGSQERKEISRE